MGLVDKPMITEKIVGVILDYWKEFVILQSLF